MSYLEYLFTTPIEELREQGIIPERKPDINKKMNLLTFRCAICSDEYTADYKRNIPDKVSRGMHCIHCKQPTMFLVSAIPYTIHYRDDSINHASFGDDISQECWLCQTTQDIHPVKFSNGVEVKACKEHLKPIAKEAYKAETRKYSAM